MEWLETTTDTHSSLIWAELGGNSSSLLHLVWTRVAGWTIGSRPASLTGQLPQLRGWEGWGWPGLFSPCNLSHTRATAGQTSACGSCVLGGCYGLNEVLTPNTLQNMTAIEDRAFKEVIKVN